MEATQGSDARVAAAFAAQARSCDDLGSPFTARLLRVLAPRLPGRGPLGARLHGWPGDITARGDAVALRVAGGLHALVLSGRDAALAVVYGDPEAGEAELADAALAAMARHERFLCDWVESPPQTNEVGRSAAVIAAGHWLAARVGLPMILSELGASAGLNLLWDRHALKISGARFGPAGAALTLRPAWQGALPPASRPEVVARAGVDRNPLDPVEDRLRLLAYVWADQAARLDRARAALQVAAVHRPEVARGDAIDWLDRRLRERWEGRLHLVFHTIAWQYFPPASRARGAALIEAAGAAATPSAPLAHLAMEADGAGPGAALRMRLWPGGEDIALARVDFHGRWIDWRAPGIDAEARFR